MSRRAWIAIAVMVGLASLLSACRSGAAQPDPTIAPDALQGTVIIFHAGSLSVPVDALTSAFQAAHPHVSFQTEASGSNAAARKISELKREADVMMSADYVVIDKLLIPEYADWNIQFARNEMVLAYTDHSRFADEITSDNWYEILTPTLMQTRAATAPSWSGNSQSDITGCLPWRHC